VADAVLDASALLAIILKEPIGDLADLLDCSVISAVNLTEVRTKLIDLQLLDIRSIEEDLRALVRVEPFTEEQAVIAADLRRITRSLGLSLGDRACLALGISLGGVVYTADRAWVGLKVGCKIVAIR
jgi:PIN domain nuclease of toxin-antitoxin system